MFSKAWFSSAALVLLACPLSWAGDARVSLAKVPHAGIQPQVVVDPKGKVHLLCFRGEPRAGNLMYMHRDAGNGPFSEPLRVNSQEGSAIAVGSIRGGQLAIGRNGRVHVVWNGSQVALPKNPIEGTPLLYSRLNDAGTAFEPQRNVMSRSAILDGGGTIAADKLGNVYLAWHALGQDLIKGENHRKVWVSVSSDDGQSFAAEKPAWNENTGACGCCGMRGYADSQGNAYFLYRGAVDKLQRGMYLIRTDNRGSTFTGSALDEWKIPTCPMSTEAFAEGKSGIIAAWDNDGQIYFTRFQPGKPPATPQPAPGDGANRKHPALAVNQNGDFILVWTEGTGWNRGGALAWQVYDKAGRPTGESGRRAGAIPVWGLPAVIAETDGRFVIWH